MDRHVAKERYADQDNDKTLSELGGELISRSIGMAATIPADTAAFRCLAPTCP